MTLEVVFPLELSPKDELYLKHKEILNMCIKHEVSLPSETAKFFRVRESESSKVDLSRKVRVPISMKKIDILKDGFSSEYYDEDYGIMSISIPIKDVIEHGSKEIIVQLYGFTKNSKE